MTQDSQRWWRRRRPARAVSATVWVVAIGAWAWCGAILVIPSLALGMGMADKSESSGIAMIVAFVALAIAVGIDLLTARGRGADPNLAPGRLFGAAPMGLGIGFILAGLPYLLGWFDEAGMPDDTGASFLVVGAVMFVAGTLIFSLIGRSRHGS